VLGAAPFVAAQALLARGEDMKGVLVRGIDPALEPQVTDLAAELRKDTVLPRLVPGEFGIVLGGELARSLGVRQGDPVTLIAQRPGHAGRRGAAPEADDGGGHL
jgi:lipoprotein-releasing system permease protein